MQQIDHIEEIIESVFNVIYPLITLRKIGNIPVSCLPLDKIIAEWIILDRVEKP